jgi:hypothetical protein
MPCHGATNPEAGVMVPRPATAPEIMPSTDGLRRIVHSIAPQVSAPAQAARWVAVIAITAREFAARADPPIEPNPADPQQSSAHHGERQVERRQIFGAIAMAPPDHLGCNEAADAGAKMHHEAAGKIQDTHGAEKAAAPHPMRERNVDEHEPSDGKHEIGREPHPVGDGTRHQ